MQTLLTSSKRSPDHTLQCCLVSCLCLLLFTASRASAEEVHQRSPEGVANGVANGFPNGDLETGELDGWVVGGRKDARGEVVSTGDMFQRLERSRSFRQAGGWEKHPLAKNLNRANNRFALQISSDGYIQATTQSAVRIEAGKQYTVSIIVESLNGGDATYFLEVYAIDDQGKRLALGTAIDTVRSETLFRQAFRFTAEPGQAHIGQRIGMTARYRGRNNLDNAAIAIRPYRPTGLEAIARNLPLVNTIDAHQQPRFAIRGYADFRYRQALPATGSLDNVGGPSPALARFAAADQPDYTLYDLEGFSLADGESAAVTVNLIDARAHAGFAVDGHVFLLGRHGNRGTKRDDGSGINPFRTPDYMMHIARVSQHLGPETILISRAGERIHWFTCGRKGSYTIRGLVERPRLSVFARQRAIWSHVRKGTLARDAQVQLNTLPFAPRHPHGRPNTPGFPGTQTKDDRVLIDALATELSQPLSAAEIEAMVQHVASYNPHGFGTRADPLFSLPEWAIPARIFTITRRRDVLDHLLRIADPAILIRNGFEVDGSKYGVRFGGEFDRYLNLHDFCIFPEGGFLSEQDLEGKYFSASREYVRDEISGTSDSANARMITPSLAAYCVALHPEIWDEEVSDGDPCKLGRTYRQRAQRYLTELALNYADYRDHKLVNFQADYLWENYTDFHRDQAQYLVELEAWRGKRDAIQGTAALAIFLRDHPEPRPKERRAGINRFVAATSCAGFAARAAERLGDETSAATIDSCAEKILNSWFNTYQFYAPGHDGQHLNEPDKWYRAWGYQPNCVNPNARDYDTNTPRGKGQVRGEDRAHMNFTLKAFYLLYESGRYPHIMTEKRMRDLARTFDEMVLPQYDQWRPLPRASKHPNVDPMRGIGPVRIHPLRMFADFNERLKAKVTRAMIEGTDERGILINRLMLAEMRAERHDQVPKSLVSPEPR